MPLTERDPNVSGRTSRASVTSAGSKAVQLANELKSDTLAAPPGVMSMLRTSTDFGDIGSLQSRMPARPQSSRRSSGAVSRLSTDSSISHVTNRASNHRAWPSASSGPRRSITSTLTVPNPFPDTGTSTLMSLPGVPQNGRAFSMTHSGRPAHGLPNHRSLTSLRGHEPISRPRSPYRYPTRLKRPGYRPSSPALSDVTGMQPQRIHAAGLGSRRRRSSHLGPLPGDENRHPLPYPQVRNRSAPSVPTMLSMENGHRPYPHDRNMSGDTLDVPMLAAARHHGARTPSTDPASSAPPTPNDVSPAQVVINAAGAPPMSANQVDQNMDMESAGPTYYDYSEQFEKETQPAPQGPAVPLGFVQRIRSILEERNKGGATPASNSVHIPAIAELPGSEIAELPGSSVSPVSPAMKRITREMILANIEPSSDGLTTVENTATNVEVRPDIPPKDEPKNGSQLFDASAPAPAEKQEGSVPESVPRTSAETSNSAAIEYAVGYSMPGSYSSGSSQVELTSSDSQSASKGETPATESQSDVKQSDELSPAIVATPEKVKLLAGQRPKSAMLLSSSPPVVDNGSSVSNTRFSAPSSQYSSPPTGADGMSQAIADFAKRFSIAPYTAPQEPSTDSPLPANAVSPIAVTITDATTTNTDLSVNAAPRSVSPVSALEETPKSRDSNTTTHLVWPQKPAVLASESASTPKSVQKVVVASQETSATEPRVSFSTRSPPSQLSDVKEEPGEDGSIPDLRVSNFKFPFPKAASLRTSVEKDRLPVKRPRASTVHTSGALSETRGIPSLNFSKTDLFAKLNEAFVEHRASRSLDDIPLVYPEIHAPVPERPASSGLIRDKYKSLFTSLDNVDPMAEETVQDPTMQEPTRTDVAPTVRPLSPQELITEVDRLSIPSMNQLTQRLSELIPSLKRYYSSDDQEDGVASEDAVQLTIEEIRGLGRHQPVVKEADLELLDNIERDKPAPRGLDESHTERLNDTADESGDSSSTSLDAEKRRSVASGKSTRRTPIAELEAPLPAVTRVKSASGEEHGLEDLDRKRSLLARTSRRSLVSSPSARPWNLEASYPWGNSPKVDISFPAPAYQHNELVHKPSKLRLRISDSSNGSEHTVKFDSSSSPTTGDSTENSHDTFKRKASMKNVVGSIKRKMGLGSPIDNSGFATGPNLLNKDDRAVDPGDRYPTTGLSPPSNLNVDECHSFFSDDSSQTHRNNSFRKRLTQIKAKLPPMARSLSAMDARSPGNASDSLFGDRAAGEDDSTRSYDGPGGMSKTEFRARRLVEKIKTLWYRSGELLRSMSGKKKREETHAWIEESEISAYSGV